MFSKHSLLPLINPDFCSLVGQNLSCYPNLCSQIAILRPQINVFVLFQYCFFSQMTTGNTLTCFQSQNDIKVNKCEISLPFLSPSTIYIGFTFKKKKSFWYFLMQIHIISFLPFYTKYSLLPVVLFHPFLLNHIC